jgi:hypothetical protein
MSHLDAHKVRLIISGIRSGFVPIPVYRKARGPYRYLQHTPVIQQMFPQLGSPLIAVTPVIDIIYNERYGTPVSCSVVHSCA